jgi:glycolate oxidase FAD binding subunit
LSALDVELERLLGKQAVSPWSDPRTGQTLAEVAPASVEELTETVRFAARGGLRILPCGRGSKLALAPAPESADFALSTRRLTGLLRYEPLDSTVSALAGTGFAELRDAVAAGGHWLTPDVGAAREGTLGGVLACGASGIDRTRFGPLRHHVLGMRVVLGDGSPAKTGGQLVKNVTGYDLHRLYCGSFGTLCVIVEASLRLFPQPEHRISAAWNAPTAAAAIELARTLGELPIRPYAVVVWNERRKDEETWRLLVHVAGKEEVAESEAEMLARSAGGCAISRGAEAVRAYELVRELERAQGSWADLHIAALPSHLDPLLAHWNRWKDALAPASLRIQPGIAIIELTLGDAPGDVGRMVNELRAAFEPKGARVWLRNAARFGADTFGAHPRGSALMVALRAALDPGSTFAAGGFLDRP